jgi:hypothetical protein
LLANHGEDEQSQVTVIKWSSAATAADSMLAMRMLVASAIATPRFLRVGGAAAVAVSMVLVHTLIIDRDISVV